MFVKVAEHTFQLTGADDGQFRRLLPNFVPFIVEDSDVVLFSCALDVPVHQPLQKPDVEFDYTLANGEQVLMKIFPGGDRTFDILVEDAVYKSKFNPQESVYESDALLKNAPRYIIDHLLVQAFALATLPLQTLLIHASTIRYDNCAVLFLAESGTGKSTHTRLWRENIEGVELLNDDAPSVRVIDGRVVAFGTPWSGKLPCWRNESAVVRGFVRIRRAQFNHITQLSALKSITALLPSCLPTLQRTDADLDRIFDTLSATISSTEVYTLECLPNPDAAQTAYLALFGEKDG